MSPDLIWGPVCQALEAHICSGDPLLLLISPFIGLNALKKFLQRAGAHHNTKVIVRWRPEDVRTGVSDIAIYPYLVERGILLYVNFDIHLKLYVFESNIAFNTSGNLTLRGFGYSEKSNVEVGSFVQLTHHDWSRLYNLINSSRQIDDIIYQRYIQYVESCPKVSIPDTPPFDLYNAPKAYTISSLPAMESPSKLAEYYFAEDKTKYSADDTRRAAHDFVTFEIQPGMNKYGLDQQLSNSFRKLPFVSEFIKVLKSQKSIRFGAVNEWIHKNCEDVPLPYKWEIKENTRIFYNWLDQFFPEITWDRPNFSQVIYWNAM
jgi:hypothetical protein